MKVAGWPAALDAYLGDAIQPTSAVGKCLQTLGEQDVPNEPNTAAQGSFHMVPGRFLGAYNTKFNLTSVLSANRWDFFIEQEEEWRHLATGGPPEPIAIDLLTGAPIVNLKTGKPVPVTLTDEQHFELLPHLWIGLLSDTSGILARQQCNELVDWAVNWAQTKAATEDNPRALGWVLGKMAEVAKVNLALGVKDDRPNIVAKLIVKRLMTTNGLKNGIPYLVLNAEGVHQADHGFCRVCVWMQARITFALAEWLELAPWYANLIPVGFWMNVWFLYMRGTAAQRWIMEQAEEDGAPEGGCYDDYDPDGKVYVHKDKDLNPLWNGVMIPFWLPATLAAKKNAPQHWDFFRPRIQNYYLTADRFVFNANKPGAMDHHTASVAIMMAPEFGWKEQP